MNYDWDAYGQAGIQLGGGWAVSTQGSYGQSLPVRLAGIDGIGPSYKGWAWPLT